MQVRVHEEIQLLKQRFPLLENGENWVKIPDLPLPAGRFNKERTTVLFVLPVGYPNSGPDNFFADMDLRLKDGSTPPAFNLNSNSSSGAAPIEGSWGWFSWHPQSWRPAATIEKGDNLLVFVTGIQMCLRGEEAQ